jgi:hypothetical protein
MLDVVTLCVVAPWGPARAFDHRLCRPAAAPRRPRPPSAASAASAASTASAAQATPAASAASGAPAAPDDHASAASAIAVSDSGILKPHCSRDLSRPHSKILELLTTDPSLEQASTGAETSHG